MTYKEAEKITQILEFHLDLYHVDMICRAISDDSISIDDVVRGYEKIMKYSERDFGEYTPQEFKNV